MDAAPIQYCKTSDGVSIAYWMMGEGEPPLVISPPLAWSHISLELRDRDLADWYEHLASRRMVVRYDPRNQGLSDREVERFSEADLTADLEAVLERLGSPQVDLLGCQGPGAPVLRVAAEHPERVRKLIVWSVNVKGPAARAKERQRALLHLAETDWALFTNTFAATQLGWTGELASQWARFMRRAVGPRDAAIILDGLGRIDWNPWLAKIRAPVLVLRGWPYDPDTEGRWADMADVRLVDLGRRDWAKQTEVARAAIDAFLAEGEEQARSVVRGNVPSGTGATIRVPSGSVHTFAAGRYTVVRQLGEGAQKTVYLVRDTALDRHCALALLKTEAMDADGIFRIKREAQAMGSLTHPNIVIVYDVGEEAGRPYIVCEYMPGGDLQQELRRAAGPLPLDRTLAIGQDVCRALAAAHQRGITHRDVKPGNIWLMEDGGAKLGDFGLALAIDRSRLTMAGTAMGTAAYMAPEQTQGQATDARTDLYSLGCLLYELATGRPPFIADDPIAVVSQHIHATPLQPSHYHADVPERLERLILRLLAKAQRDRPASAGEVLQELEEIAAGK